jgi:hypothetical protein
MIFNIFHRFPVTIRWGCVPQLKDVVDELEFINHYIYEIKNCVRTSDLASMVEDLNETMENVKYHLSKIKVTNEYKTMEYEG